MTGKSYSVREMKTIVEYLTENKLYGEIRGRKMWMEFANTKLTTRTWQSLKETFLKRIFPDIHNPYYKLSIEQINSFRAGYDVSDKNKNKLEIHTLSDDSNDQNQNDTAQSNNDYGIREEIMAGENIKCSKIPSQNRSSADTVIVDTCYETAEDIQKDLESPGGNKETKSLRDCITYSEPLTPMLQEVLDDFQSEPENEPEASDREGQVEISKIALDSEDVNKKPLRAINGNVESAEHQAPTNGTSNQADPAVAPVKEADPGEKGSQPTEKQNKTVHDDEKDSEVVCLDDYIRKSDVPAKHTDNGSTTITKENAVENTDVPKVKDPEHTEITVVHDSNSESVQPSGALSNTTDASLPNNPEALKVRISNEEEDIQMVSNANKSEKKITRKRSNSEATRNKTTKKTKLDKKTEATSETESMRTALKVRISNEEEDIQMVSNPNKSEKKITRKRSNSEATRNKTTKETKLDKKTEATSETESMRTIEAIIEPKPRIVETKNLCLEGESIPKKTDEPNQSKASASIANDGDKILLTSDTDQSTNLNESEIKNPCLQNVSLFDEQFKKSKYNTSESDESKKKKTEVVNDKSEENRVHDVTKNQNEVVMLKSHTESDTEPTPPPKKKIRPGVISSKADRDRALGNLFGFSSGATNSKRRRQLSRRRRTISQNNISQNAGPNSSEWTSDFESNDYVSPPRSRKNRPTRKYLKPQSARILSLEEEGGLFVMHGKKIYPLVKDGKLVKNYLTYLSDSDSEEDQNYWKLKYEEEKKKASELKKLLQKAKRPHSRDSTSPAVHPSPSRSSTCHHNLAEPSTSNAGKEICLAENDAKRLEPKATASGNIKIKFTTKNDQEIHLEGNWPQIHNVLEHVVHIFQKDPQPASDNVHKSVVEPPSSSGISTPLVITSVHEPGVDPEVHEKVNKIESEIFKEIEDRHKEEQSEPNITDKNVTKRKTGRPRKPSQSSVSQSPAKRAKTTDQPEPKEPEVVKETIGETGNDVKNDESKIQSRTPRRNLNDSLNNDDPKPLQTRRSKLNTSKTNLENEDEVRYMFPPKSTRQAVKSTTDKNPRQKPQKSATIVQNIISSLETVCSNSLESTQGYQDSDPSPMKTEFRKKKMINASEIKFKTMSHVRRSSRKQSHPYLYYDAGDSSNSSDVSLKKNAQKDSTLNSIVYKSESYQLLMPGSKKHFKQLDPIDETRPVGKEVEFIKHLDSTDNNEVFSVQVNTTSHKSGPDDSDFGSSSVVSLPLSPELSVVESLSISKDLLNSGESGPTINEMQCNETLTVPTTCNQYLISQIDVSVPLMQQECGLENSNLAPNNNTANQQSLVTESLVNKIGTINITDQTNVTDNLDVKLRDLLLESAKKLAVYNQENNMDIDETNNEIKKKSKNKKRCSTPRKRKDSTKSKKVTKVQPVIEEEHVESFANGGRQSCPPIIQTLELEENEEINIGNLNIDENVKPKGRKKKDVIKVKITRPKSKKPSNNTTKSKQSTNKNSNCTDSGINDTESGVFLRGDESVDLIHNHSDTCLHANDCVGDSVEFVDNSEKSVLTLSDSMQSIDDILWQNQCEFSDAQNIPDFYSSNAQDVKRSSGPKIDDVEACETVYHSPLSAESSLITEDLSDDAPQPYSIPNKWRLLSEDETTTTTMANVPPTNGASFISYLRQIFPITCAVPDLSTITEMSGDDNSRKAMLERANGSDSIE